jgi:hypothetical protein
MEKNELKPNEIVNLHLHYLDHFFRVEQNEGIQSEQRIKFFLTLTAGVIALLSAFSKFNPSAEKESLIILAVFLLFSFLLGLFVFASIIWSDRKIKQHRKLWNESYEVIKNIDPSVVRYKKVLKEMDDKRICKPLQICKGTLTQIIWFVEGILVLFSVFVLGITTNSKLVSNIILSSVITSIVLLLLWWWASYVKKGIEKNKNKI